MKGRKEDNAAASNSTDGLVLPSSLRTSLVFSHETLDKLRGRREEMLGEVDVLKKRFKALHGTKRKLQGEEDQTKEIEKQESRCVELQMLKFGQIIDLASLDQMGDRKMVDDLNKKISGSKQSTSGNTQNKKGYRGCAGTNVENHSG